MGLNILKRLATRTEKLISSPGEELGRWARFLQFQANLWRFCLRRLHTHNAAAMSAALSFRTIFAMVPILALSLLVAKSLHVLPDARGNLQKLLEATGISQIAVTAESAPASSPESSTAQTQPATQDAAATVARLADWIESLVSGVESKLTLGRIGPIGVALLIWTALSLLSTMEGSLNRVFEAPRSRSVGRRVLLYWSALTLAPVAAAAASYAGTYTGKTVANVHTMSWLITAASWAGPVLVQMLLLGALYKLMPNTRVSFRAALGGALVAVPLWLLAKWGFAIYVERLVRTGNLYGIIGLAPLFLMWMNICWLIFLFGAELAHTAANLNRMRLEELAERTTLGPADMLAAALAVAGRYVAGRGAAELPQVAEELGLPDESAQQLLNRLAAAGVVCPVDAEEQKSYILARPVEQVRVLDVMEFSPEQAQPTGRRFEEGLARMVKSVQGAAGDALGKLSLADVLKNRQ